MATGMIYFIPPPPQSVGRAAAGTRTAEGSAHPAWPPGAEHSPADTPSPSPSCLHPPGLERWWGTRRHGPRGRVSRRQRSKQPENSTKHSCRLHPSLWGPELQRPATASGTERIPAAFQHLMLLLVGPIWWVPFPAEISVQLYVRPDSAQGSAAPGDGGTLGLGHSQARSSSPLGAFQDGIKQRG